MIRINYSCCKAWILTILFLELGISGVLAQNNSNIEIGSLLQKPDMKEIVYKSIGETKLKIYYTSPSNVNPGDKRAAVVFIHGGGWVAGGADVFFMHARYFALRGAVGFSIEYRLLKASGPTMADCLADCKSAIRYIRIHAKELGIDPNKIVVIGDSAGGHLASCLGTIDGYDDPKDNLTISAKVNAMVLCNPLSDFTNNTFIKFIIGGAALDKNPTPEALMPTQAQIELARKLSPIFNVHKNQPPTLVMHGIDDKVILPEQSKLFTEAMKRAGNRCDLLLFENTRHAFILPNYTATEEIVVNAVRQADMFLVSLKYLKGSPNLVVSKEPSWIPKGQKK
jgi:acetyl esterase